MFTEPAQVTRLGKIMYTYNSTLRQHNSHSLTTNTSTTTTTTTSLTVIRYTYLYMFFVYKKLIHMLKYGLCCV